jgi:hypothetical protein
MLMRLWLSRSNVGANFMLIEDIMLASACAFVTTNAAVGTDQDGNMFYDKICESFIKHEGQEGRTWVFSRISSTRFCRLKLTNVLVTFKIYFVSTTAGGSLTITRQKQRLCFH